MTTTRTTTMQTTMRELVLSSGFIFLLLLQAAVTEKIADNIVDTNWNDEFALPSSYWNEPNNYDSDNMASQQQPQKRSQRRAAVNRRYSQEFSQWAAGITSWPTIELDYGGMHPFEQLMQHERQIESSSTSDSNYHPLGITFITDPLLSKRGQNDATDAEINFILDTILLQVQNTWSAHLSVIPNKLPIPIDSSVCYGLFENSIPSNIIQNGVNNADLVIIASAINNFTDSDGTVSTFCQDTTIAAALHCATDKFDRPVIGFINFCLGNIAIGGTQQRRLRRGRRRQQLLRRASHDTNNQHTTAHDSASFRRSLQSTTLSNGDVVSTALHEIGHVLGMNNLLFPYFWDPITKQPRTPRPILEQEITCTSGVIRNVKFPANNTLQMGTTSRGAIYYDVVTPRVQDVVRNHFNCQSLNGARLENQDTSPSDCSGSHWDLRLFYGELMEPVLNVGSSSVLSPLTLALMEDTGWYRVDYSNTSLSAFGQGAGCDFVNGDCIVNDAVPDYGRGYFCTSITPVNADGKISANGTDIFCDPNHYEWNLCNLFDLDQAPASFVEEVNSEGEPIRYFSSNQSLVAFNPQADSCPTPDISLRVYCTSTDSASQAFQLYQGEQYGPSSRCINVQYNSVLGRKRNRPGCFEIECDAEAFKVIVGGISCDSDFQEITIETVNSIPVTMTCPRLSSICPDLFCRGDCSGRGTCNYNKRPPTCECFNSSDTSPDCGNTLFVGTALDASIVPTSTTPPSTTSTSPISTQPPAMSTMPPISTQPPAISTLPPTSTQPPTTNTTNPNCFLNLFCASTSTSSSPPLKSAQSWISTAMGAVLLFWGACFL